MKRKCTTLVLLFGLLLALMTPITTLAQTTDLQTDFTYEGFLSNAGGAVTASCNFQFSLFDAVTAGNQIGAPQMVNAITVMNGAFSVQLDFGASVFNGQDRFLEIAVQCAGDAGFTTLAPRQPVTPAPYAGYALSVPWAGVTGAPQGFADGVDNEGWGLIGNAGTTPGTNFIGTTDNVALEFFVNNLRALRIEPAVNGVFSGNNVIGGYDGNTVAAGVVGATVLGGGQEELVVPLPNPNSVTADFGTVGGGAGNTASNSNATVGGGLENTASGNSSTVGGGIGNTASNSNATVGGGLENTASGFDSTVGGGFSNLASGNGSTVGGGSQNIASGFYATVSGGLHNEASDSNATVGGGIGNTAGFAATVGGGIDNIASGGYATIAGGGPSDPINNPTTTNNAVYDDYGTIGGGGNNLVGNNDGDTTTAQHGTVGGGSSNTASNTYSTVSGGYFNTASGIGATVGGGGSNTASGSYSMVGGGGINTAAGAYSFAAGRNASADHTNSFVWNSSSVTTGSTAAGQFVARAYGGFTFYTAISGTTTGATLPASGGSWASLSDRDAKNSFQAINPRAILDALMAIPITTWNYNGQDESIRHIGPVSQDFYAAFRVGEDDQHITTVDADGVALAAIQGLYEMVQEKDAQIAALQTRQLVQNILLGLVTLGFFTMAYSQFCRAKQPQSFS